MLKRSNSLKKVPLKRKCSLKRKNVLKGHRSPSQRKSETPAQLKRELDKYFSLYIRQKYADKDGNVECYTCGKMCTVKTIQCGHFISRSYLATRWDEDNCRPQEIGCNVYGHGKPLDFEERLKKELGSDYVEQMKLKRHTFLKLNKKWYEETIQVYKDKLLSL